MTAQLAIGAASQALDAAGITRTVVDEKRNVFALCGRPRRWGVYLGTGIGGITSFAANQAHHLYAPVAAALVRDGRVRPDEISCVRFPPRFNPFAVAMTMPNGASAALGTKWNLHGANCTVAGACAAGTMAIGRAFEAVREGRLDAALSGGVEYCSDDWGGVFRGFDMARTLAVSAGDPKSANRPFDNKRTGFLFAEGGAAALVLERLEHALERGATPIAEIAAFAESFDAHSAMAMEPSGAHIESMVRELCDRAETIPGEVDYVNAHGTGTAANDEIEARMIQRVFGASTPVNATKSLIGHTIGAAGAIETVVTALTLATQFTHGCCNLDEPVVPINFMRRPGPVKAQTAVTQSFAFGGHNAGLFLRAFQGA